MAGLKFAVVILLLFGSMAVKCDNKTTAGTNKTSAGTNNNKTTAALAKTLVSDDAVAIDAVASPENFDNLTSPNNLYGPPSGSDDANGYPQGTFDNYQPNTNPFVYGVRDDAGSYGAPLGNPLSYSAPSESKGYNYSPNPSSSGYSNNNHDSNPPADNPPNSNDDIVVVDNPTLADSHTNPLGNNSSNNGGSPNSSGENSKPSDSYGTLNPSFGTPSFSNGYGYQDNNNSLNSSPSLGYTYSDNMAGQGY